MTDYSNQEAYFLRSQILYRPERFYYPNGNNPKTYFKDFGQGRPSLPWQASSAGQAINNPFVEKTCYQQPPIVWMQSAPYDPRTGKFTDTYFYKNLDFSMGSN